MSFASTRGGRRRSVAAAATAALALSALLATSAKADIVFYDSPGGVQPEENVLLPSNQVGLTINGVTNQSNTIVLFSQPTLPESLTTPSSGQARIASVDTVGFTSLRTELLGGVTFTEFEADPHFLSAGITFTVGVVEDNGTLSQHNFVSGAGQSYFGIEAINGQRIRYIDIDSALNPSAIVDIRQIRIGGIAGVTPVPEPGAIAFGVVMGGGLLGLIARGRRRSRSGGPAAA